jgi:hypothetical protein
MCDRPTTVERGRVSRGCDSLRAEQRADKLSAAPHADFVEHRLEVVLDSVAADAKLGDDLGGGPSLQDSGWRRKQGEQPVPCHHQTANVGHRDPVDVAAGRLSGRAAKARRGAQSVGHGVPTVNFESPTSPPSRRSGQTQRGRQQEGVKAFSPMLAGRKAARAADGVSAVADQLSRAIVELRLERGELGAWIRAQTATGLRWKLGPEWLYESLRALDRNA